MARPLRIELAGALYHVTSRGDGREDTYIGEDDRKLWLEILRQVCERFNWTIHPYCQMVKHNGHLYSFGEPLATTMVNRNVGNHTSWARQVTPSRTAQVPDVTRTQKPPSIEQAEPR